MKYVGLAWKKEGVPPTVYLRSKKNIFGISFMGLHSMIHRNNDGKSGTLVGYYKPEDKSGFGIIFWPITFMWSHLDTP